MKTGQSAEKEDAIIEKECKNIICFEIITNLHPSPVSFSLSLSRRLYFKFPNKSLVNSVFYFKFYMQYVSR